MDSGHHGLQTPSQGINQRNLKIWEWELIFGCAVMSISSLGVRSPWWTPKPWLVIWFVCLFVCLFESLYLCYLNWWNIFFQVCSVDTKTMTCARAPQACWKGMIDILGTELRTNSGSNAFTATVCPQLCTRNFNHAFLTDLQDSGTNHGFGVH